MTLDLKDLGWDDQWARTFEPHRSDGLVPARVAIEFNYLYRLFAEVGELQAQHAGKLRHESAHLSAVGDWVAVRPTPGEAAATIEAILPRRSKFSGNQGPCAPALHGTSTGCTAGTARIFN